MRYTSIKIGLIISLYWIGGALFGQELLTLDRSLEIAMANSPTMQQVQLSLEFSQQKLNAQRARLKSQFGLTLDPINYRKSNTFDRRTSEWYLNEYASSSGTFSITQRILPTDGVLSLNNTFSYDYNYTESKSALDEPSSTYNNDLYLRLTQPIFTYNRTRVELDKVKLNYENALLRYLLQKLSLERNVAQSFFGVYSRQMSLNIAKEELKNNEESYGIIKNKVDGGLMALEELYQAEVNLANSRSSVYNAELNLQNAMDQFKVLIGMDVTEEFMIMADIEIDTVAIDNDLALKHALDNRMEIRQRQIDIENSMFSLTDARTTNEFAGSISASIGLQANNEDINLLFDKFDNSPAVGLTLSIPIFDWGERKSEIKAAEANVRSSEIDLNVEKTDIIVNVRSTLRSLQNLLNQIEIQRKTVKNAELTYQINLERYRNGDLTSLDLGIYQNQLSDRKVALTNAIIDYKLELLNLKIQTLYDFELNMPIIPDELKQQVN